MDVTLPYRFSIILPVRNGGSYIKECVASVLSQTVKDFDLIILDSGSTDGTIAWLESLNDPRIVLHLADKPLSITENWSRIKTVERNKWMTIIGHDDLLHANYLEIISSLIEKFPDASLYQAHFNLINAKGELLRPCKTMSKKLSAKELLDNMLNNTINIFGTGFMLRSADYDRVGGMPMFPNLMSADYALWLEVSSLSYLAVSPEVCFSYRINQSTTATTDSETYITSLKCLIDYLLQAKERLSSGEKHSDYVKRILIFYCKRVSRRLLTVKLEDRNGLTVSKFLKQTVHDSKSFLDAGEDFNPTSTWDIWIAKMLDSNSLGRRLFLFVKKLHPNPIL